MEEQSQELQKREGSHWGPCWEDQSLGLWVLLPRDWEGWTRPPHHGDLRSHRRDPNWGLGTSSGSPEGLGLDPSEVGSQGKQWGRGCMEIARKVEGLAQTPKCPVCVHTHT